MEGSRVLLSVRRFRQKPSECALAAAASLANYFDPSIDYKQVSEMLEPNQKEEGIDTAEECSLLNRLGFHNITIVTADLKLFDFTWNGLDKCVMVDRLRKVRDHYKTVGETGYRDYAHNYIKWLSDKKCDNLVIIDNDFPKYIKRHLNAGKPVGAGFNWTSMFKFSKYDGNGRPNDIKGEHEEHAVVIRGYDDKGVFVVDSHYRFYTGPRRKYRNGYYKLSWAKFLVNFPSGDLILIGNC